jgi:TolB protein
MARYAVCLSVVCLAIAWGVAGAASDSSIAPRAQGGNLGLFESHGDVGTVLHPGSASFEEASASYTIRGSGQNMWFARDDFQFVWKKMSGDLVLAADVAFAGAGKEPHRKACLMIRQSLDSDSVYADAALHGDGLTSLQFREAKGAATH